MKFSTDQWLTRKRLRAHGLLLALALWSLYVWTVATPGLRDRNRNLRGTDFLHLYTLGSLAISHRGSDLYNMNAQAALAAERVPDAAGIRYLPLYPPQVSILFAPFAEMSYASALALWWICSAAIYGICCWSIWRACPKLRDDGSLVALLAIANPAFFNLISWGQTSAIALVCFTGMFFLLRDHRDFAAGLVLGCLIFKPQLGLASAIVFVASGAWMTVAGAFISASIQLCLGVLYYGVGPFRQWLQTLRNIRTVRPLFEPRPYQTHCLRTFWSMIIPWSSLSFALYLVSALVILVLMLGLWHRDQPLKLRYSGLLLTTVLVAPHLTVYDLLILAPAILLLSDWLLGQSAPPPGFMGTMIYLVFALPLLAPLTRWTHVQFSIIAMMVLLYLIWRSRSVDADLQ